MDKVGWCSMMGTSVCDTVQNEIPLSGLGFFHRCTDRLHPAIPAICRGFNFETFVFLSKIERAGRGLSDWSRCEDRARIQDFSINAVKRKTKNGYVRIVVN
jgi:hypothetical protein